MSLINKTQDSNGTLPLWFARIQGKEQRQVVERASICLPIKIKRKERGIEYFYCHEVIFAEAQQTKPKSIKINKLQHKQQTCGSDTLCLLKENSLVYCFKDILRVINNVYIRYENEEKISLNDSRRSFAILTELSARIHFSVFEQSHIYIYIYMLSVKP